MKGVLQRVRSATCRVEERVVGDIDAGVVVFLGIEPDDTGEDVEAMVEQVVTVRIFEDDNGRMDESIEDVGGAVMVIPNFTLCADLSSGRRPGFENAADPDLAEERFDQVVRELENRGVAVASGQFGAMMEVQVNNDGPVTLMLDSDE